ncbi:hypothetical protein CALK_1017 [Chitinivibrio alkaliphilus ACht1]|uniref:Uncharacterized protein n=1 Tax=Chitinivibrio alkaliphilus ACht1 TaxID=1313304 RepID=U7D8X4_9BACT|nr:hypothetical protein CALK_1017 [Chitinivibrio alkaliphilus ACht1]
MPTLSILFFILIVSIVLLVVHIQLRANVLENDLANVMKRAESHYNLEKEPHEQNS